MYALEALQATDTECPQTVGDRGLIVQTEPLLTSGPRPVSSRPPVPLAARIPAVGRTLWGRGVTGVLGFRTRPSLAPLGMECSNPLLPSGGRGCASLGVGGAV